MAKFKIEKKYIQMLLENIYILKLIDIQGGSLNKML